MGIHPQYITDANGNKSMVILPVEEFERIMEELEDFADIQLYDEAKKNDTGERIPFEEAFKMIEERRKKNKLFTLRKEKAKFRNKKARIWKTLKTCTRII